MTKQEVEKLLKSLADIELPAGAVPADEFAKNVYATPQGKKVIDTFNENGITLNKLEKWGFVTAWMALNSMLKD